MNKIGKYEFNSESAANTAIDALGTATDENGDKYATHKHTIVKLGKIVIEAGDYDQEGKEVKAPVLSEKYHVDVLWQGLTVKEDGDLDGDHDSWDSYKIDLETEGVHGFLGLSYLEMKV